MAKSRSNNPDGRPPEYQEKLRTISLALPESLIDFLDARASEAGISRQRLIVEWLKVGVFLDGMGNLRTTEGGTQFKEWPTCQPRFADSSRTPFTNKDAFEWFSRLAEKQPDELVKGWEYYVVRDQGREVQDPGVPKSEELPTASKAKGRKSRKK